MKSIAWIVLLALSMSLAAGCGGPAADQPEDQPAGPAPGVTADQAHSTPPSATPSEAVESFLQAVREGEDQGASAMLTDLARQKTEEMDLEVAPPGSKTAEFHIGQIEQPAEGVAHVHCRWSDVDAEGSRTEESIIWMLRQQPGGWRIAGMAPTIFQGEPPVVLNFEEPEEMIRKLNWVRQEVVRRAQAEAMQQTRDADGLQPTRQAQRPQPDQGEPRR